MIDLELSSTGDVSGQEFGDQGNVGEIDEDTIINPYGYEDRESTFGLIRKKIYYPKSDFGLRLEPLQKILQGTFVPSLVKLT